MIKHLTSRSGAMGFYPAELVGQRLDRYWNRDGDTVQLSLAEVLSISVVGESGKLFLVRESFYTQFLAMP